MSQTSLDLLDVARDLANFPKATEAHFRRAVSTCYYSVFHHLLDDICEQLFKGEEGLGRAKQHIKRSITHQEIKKKCGIIKESGEKFGFPQPLVNFADSIVDLQVRRHQADYDSLAFFDNGTTNQQIDKADIAITEFDKVDKKHRLAFAAWVLREQKDPKKPSE